MPDWTFDGFGAEFDEHALKHLPHYETAYDVLQHVSTFVVANGGSIADLGCSTGYSAARIAEAVPGRRFDAWLYDVDASMLEQAEARLEHVDVRCHFRALDLTTDLELLGHTDVDLTLLLWTLQFLPPSSWVPILTAARSRSSQDGLLIVGAKSRLSDARWQEIADGALADWKWRHGVTADEALDKARSLRGTMNVVTVGRLFDAITAAGWQQPAVIFRWHAWVLLGAWASPLREVPTAS